MAQAKAFVFTINNPAGDIDFSKFPAITYAIVGNEVAPTTGTPHQQGYVLFSTKRRLSAIQKLLPTAHLSTAKGSPSQNKAYCSKEGHFIEVGTCPEITQGHRSDLDEVAAQAIGGTPISEIAVSHPASYIRYNRGIVALQQAIFKPQMRTINVIVLIGPAGTGKTRYAYDHHPIEDIFNLQENQNGSLWFDGYNRQPVLLIDDFNGWINYKVLLNILDRYPFRCQIKGSIVFASWTTVYITSDREPDLWFRDYGELTQLTRRITQIIHTNI